MTYLISVVIPVYNAEEYLQGCLNSVLSQNMNAIEIILIDDGSTDNSRAIIDKYGHRYKNILPIYQENQGVSVARNNGIKYASGDYVLFLDSDDSLKAGLFEILEETLKNNHYPDMISFGYVRKGGQKKKSKHYSFKRFDKHQFSGLSFCKFFLLKRITQCISSFVIKKERLDEYKIKFNENVTLGEDIVFQIKIMSIARTVFYLANEYFVYNYNPSSQTNKCFKENHLSCTKNYQDVNSFFIQYNLERLGIHLNYYYQYMFFYELQFFLHAPHAIFQEYLLSDSILNNNVGDSLSIKSVVLYTLKLLYRVDRKLLFQLLK